MANTPSDSGDKSAHSDPVEEATRQAQKAARDRLRTQEATVPGLPAPADPKWLKEQLDTAHSTQIPPSPVTHRIEPTGDRLLQARSFSHPAKAPIRRKGFIVNELETRLGVGQWESVYEAFQHTGKETKLAEMTGVDVDAVYYLLDTGIRRLGLPPIRDHATDDAEIQRKLDERAPNLMNALNPELDLPEIQQAVTKRAVEDAVIAAQGLEMSAKVGTMMDQWANKMMELMNQGAFSHPHQVTPKMLTDMVKALETHSRATERAVKLFRLTRGEPTENIAHQVATLLVDCSLDELKEADRKGTIPARVLSKFGAQIVDGEFEDVTDKDITDKDKDKE